MFIKRLNQILDNLTGSEEIIADYISNHLNEIGKMTSVELARRTGTAQATVIRFSKKMGYPNYKRMINDINTSDADEHIDEDITFDEDIETTKKKLKNEYSMVFDLVVEQNSNTLFQQAVEMIYKAETIIIYGITSRKGDLAHYLMGILMKIGFNVVTDSYTSTIYARLETCKKGDVLILLSESGETRELLNFAKIGKKKGVRVISITRFKKNHLAQLSDVNFKVIEYGQRTFLRNLMMMYSYNIIIDLLYLNLVKKDFDKSEKLSSRNSLVTKVNYTEV